MKKRKMSEKPAPKSSQPAITPPQFPIVGIGASAGGLAAFEAFFSGMPADREPGMAFVLVQHLAPDHKSLLPELVQRYTRMPVFEAADGLPVQPNCVYIIPPNVDLALLNGTLHLLKPSVPRGQRLPIDFFFRSLAQDRHELAIGIILSGTANDGTLGVRAIKSEGGMVVVQKLETTKFDGMPRSALATGLADLQLPPSEMAAHLIAYTAQAFSKPSLPAAPPTAKAEGALKKIFILLRAHNGHDFSQYMPSTLYRRIERRMAVHQIASIDAYVDYLQQTPLEVEALFHDFLIGVTHFFRDQEAFLALEQQAIPLLFAEQPAAGGVIRVWTVGCSTGEEAYSIAILLQERMEVLRQSHTLQIFATDLDSRAIAAARAGIYPDSIAANLSEIRLARFFEADPGAGSYRVRKALRDMVIFSEHNLISDPPFSKLDLITCRNLLIYLSADVQRKLIPRFHYALKPHGLLFLGTSEGIGDFINLFGALDRKAKLYQRKGDAQAMPRARMSRFLPPMTAIGAALLPSSGKSAFPVKLPLRELTEQGLLQHLAPVGALVDAQGDIFYLHGRSGNFLELAPGVVGINNILKTAREGLRQELSTTLHRAAKTQEPACALGLNVKTNGHFTRVNLTVCPLISGRGVAAEPPLYLVILENALEEAPARAADPTAQAALAATDEAPQDSFRIAALHEALRAKDAYLQSTQEELERSNEDLKSSNEEMQSVNEELQSTNEEMETAKEELQSINEELGSVNAELHAKVLDLTRLNNDTNNLLAGTGIATVFVDHQQRILRFTPSASAIINLIPSDVGRPVAHLVTKLRGDLHLQEATQAVLDTLVAQECEVQTTAGQWYSMRIQPYRTLDNVIEGAVLAFIGITEIVRTRDALKRANEQLRLAVVARDARDAISVHDLSGRILAWNPGAVRLYGWSEAEALQMNISALTPPSLREEILAKTHQFSRAEVLQPYLTQRIHQDGTLLEVSMIASALINEAGQMYAIATLERRKAGEAA